MSAATNPSDIYDDLNLYTTQEKFYLQPRAGNELLIIDRQTEKISLEPNIGQIPVLNVPLEFCGLLGSIKLVAGRYLIVATQRIFIGYIAGHAVWCLAGYKLLPYFRSTLHLSPEQLHDNNEYVSMVEAVLDTPYFYFSYSYDITHTFQRLHTSGPDFLKRSLAERADSRFMWNGWILKGFFGDEGRKFCLPIIHGYVGINNNSINGCNFGWTLISRRSCLRVGTRLFCRGVDGSGNVANFVETEQIVEYQGDQASFVQIRGSIPLFWHQSPDLRLKPPPELLDVGAQQHQSACGKHLEQCSLIYGRQVLVNLIDQRGAEGRICKEFEKTVQNVNNPNVKYEAFDFHSECSRMRWERLSILINRLTQDLEEQNYFLILRDGTMISLQDGVFRTNCIDCLDRTNVVQSMLAHQTLENILHKLQILRPKQKLENHKHFESTFKSVWADNADVISLQYSGTGALKTDFTRTGKRTRLGVLRDGYNSLTRYYKNNFGDGFRQDALCLFVGCVEVAPLRVVRGWRYVAFPSVFLVACAMFVASVILPAEYSTESMLYILFWGSMVGSTLYTIFRHGKEFVDRPRLSQ